MSHNLNMIPLIAALALSAPTGDLQKPFLIMDGDKPLSVDVGHAAPLVCDLYGDGKRELLVGQFGNGQLRIYRNQGTVAHPTFKGFDWFRAGGQIASIPSG